MQSKIRCKPCLFLALAGLLTSGILAGCNRPVAVETETPLPPYAGQLVKIASSSETITSLIKRYSPGWANKAGASVEIVAAPKDGDLARIADASVWIIRPAEMPRLAAAGLLTPLPSAYKAANGPYTWSGLLPLYREKLLRWAGESYALPLLGNAPICFYRADLLADAAHQKAYREKYHRDLCPPRTWDEFADIAEYFYTNKTPGQPQPSLPALPTNVEDLDALFQMVAAPHMRPESYQEEVKRPSDEELFSHHYHLKTGESRIAHPGFVYALRILQRMQRFRPESTSAAPAQAFGDGQAVLCIAEASWIARFRAKLPPTALGICEVPGSSRWFRFRDGKEMPAPQVGNHIPYQGSDGWVAVVPRSAPHPDAAFALCAYLSDPVTSAQIVFEPQWGGGVFRHDHLSSAQNWFTFELDESRTQLLHVATQQALNRPGLANPVVRLRIPDQHLYQLALIEQIREALTQNMDAQKALQEVARRWKALDDSKDKKKRIDDYRISLGLSALP
jgi:multiple sugar transport system substrate-binding protein